MKTTRIPVPGGSVHCETHGDPKGKRAMIGLHGGPGAGAAYLAPLVELADVMPLVLYDQLGCGRSDIPDDDSLWTVERFCEELDTVVEVSGMQDAVLYGHSWGGWLAIDYALRHPEKVAGLILASTSGSIKSFIDGTKPLIEALPAEHRDAIKLHDARGAYDHPDYLAAMEVFYGKHLCRSDPWPPELMESLGNLEASPVYPAMNGPNEFTVIGTLKTWDRTADLGKISCPTLVYCGEYDEIVPACTYELADRIPNATAVVVPDASHTALNERPDDVMPHLRAFLAPLS